MFCNGQSPNQNSGKRCRGRVGGTCIIGDRASPQEWQKQGHAGPQAAVSEGTGSETEDTVKETAQERSPELRDRNFQTGTACLSFSPE